MASDRPHCLVRLAPLLLMLPLFVSAAPPLYRIDPVHSRILFMVDHYGYSRALGTFSAPIGTLRFDPKDWRSASVDVVVRLDSLDLGDADWNARMLKRDFFDAAERSTARFVSNRIEPIDADRARIIGTLSLRGEEREVVLEARLNRRARHPLTLRRTVGFSATATLTRQDFGMRAWKSAVGSEVSLIIEVEANRTRRGDNEDAGAEAAPSEETVDAVEE